MSDRNQVFKEFITKNPSFANPAGHHRQLANFSFDTKYRARVEDDTLRYEDALSAARDDALAMMPIPDEKPQNINALTGADRAIAEMALARNCPVPPASGRVEAPPGNVAAICAKHAGIKTQGEDQ